MEGDVCPIPYDFCSLPCGLDQKSDDIFRRHFVSVHVQPICACCVT